MQLKQPPPLDRDLLLLSSEGGWQLKDDDTVIATAAAGNTDIALRPAPSHSDVQHAPERFVSVDDHILPECFVCGPKRSPGDGLCLFTGPVDESMVASYWTPTPDLAGPDGNVRQEFIWAALDCPSYFGLRRTDLLCLLGRMSAHIDGPIKASQRYRVAGWRTGGTGRKHLGAAAIYDDSGTALAWSDTLWVDVTGRMTLS